jgi:hypothetical protein
MHTMLKFLLLLFFRTVDFELLSISNPGLSRLCFHLKVMNAYNVKVPSYMWYFIFVVIRRIAYFIIVLFII